MLSMPSAPPSAICPSSIASSRRPAIPASGRAADETAIIARPSILAKKLFSLCSHGRRTASGLAGERTAMVNPPAALRRQLVHPRLRAHLRGDLDQMQMVGEVDHLANVAHVGEEF